jgi:hypothetical protein
MKPSLLIQALEYLVGQQRPTMIWGPPGVGKSDVVRSAVGVINTKIKDKKKHFGLSDVRLSNCDPTDLKGFPMPDSKDSTMAFFPMKSLPTSGFGVLFLDEINAAPAAVQAGAYQLILDRKIGDYELPAGWTVLAAGNRSSDRSVVHAMPAALSNRFTHLDFTVDHEDWVDWAIKNSISDTTRGYIRMQPGDLVVDKIEPGARAFHTPRTWAFADKVINSSLKTEVMLPILQGTIGEGMATKLAGFARNRMNMPDLDRVLTHPDEVNVPDSPSTRYAILAGLEPRVTKDNFANVLKYVSRMSKDFEVVFVTAADRRDPEISETRTFTQWLRDNRTLLV